MYIYNGEIIRMDLIKVCLLIYVFSIKNKL